MLNLEFKQIQKTLRSWKVIPSWIQRYLPFGKQIFMIRSALGMTQQQLARKAQTDQRAIVRLEKEETDPRISTLQKIAESLNCELMVRLVPKTDLEQFLKVRARKKAEELIKMSLATANLELQKPSKSTFRSELTRLQENVLHHKRSSLWDE